MFLFNSHASPLSSSSVATLTFLLTITQSLSSTPSFFPIHSRLPFLFSLPPADNQNCHGSKLNWHGSCVCTLYTASACKHRAQCQGWTPPLLPTYANMDNRWPLQPARQSHVHDWVRFEIPGSTVEAREPHLFTPNPLSHNPLTVWWICSSSPKKHSASSFKALWMVSASTHSE